MSVGDDKARLVWAHMRYLRAQVTAYRDPRTQARLRELAEALPGACGLAVASCAACGETAPAAVLCDGVCPCCR